MAIHNMCHNATVIKHVQHSHGISHEHGIPSASYSTTIMQYTEAIHQAQYNNVHREVNVSSACEAPDS